MEAFERCPRCRRKLAGFAVYRCPDCGAGFCAGCDGDDRSEAAVGWLAVAALEAGLDSCPVCTGAIGDGDRVGVIAGPTPGRQDAEPGAATVGGGR